MCYFKDTNCVKNKTGWIPLQLDSDSIHLRDSRWGYLENNKNSPKNQDISRKQLSLMQLWQLTRLLWIFFFLFSPRSDVPIKAEQDGTARRTERAVTCKDANFNSITDSPLLCHLSQAGALCWGMVSITCFCCGTWRQQWSDRLDSMGKFRM